MFKKFRLQNYRTHIDTIFEPKDVTLLIGSNNSGKSNLLMGLNDFSLLVRNSSTRLIKSKELRGINFFSVKHTLSNTNTPVSFFCEWEREDKKIEYELEIYCLNKNDAQIGGREKITIFGDSHEKTIMHGHSDPSQEMLLRTKLENGNLTSDEKQIADIFFRDLSFLHYYHFQPAFLKGQARPEIQNKSESGGIFPNIAREIGREGAYFQDLVKYTKKYDQVAYGEFLGYLKRFVKSFNEIIIDRDITKWQFDMGGSTFPYFESHEVSDGLLKAGAVALLCAMKKPPAMIMIEEIENGINQRNLSEFMGWLFDISDKGENTQFILTSHSPSVIREFSDCLDAVYNLHLREKDHRSMLTNLNDAIKPLVNMGSVDGEIVEENGKELAHVKSYKLTELFYNGVLGGL